jgi:hypothetical protein
MTASNIAGEGACGPQFIFLTPGLLRPGVCMLGLRPSADVLQPWVTLGRLGWNWVDIGGGGRGWRAGRGNLHPGGKRDTEKS